MRSAACSTPRSPTGGSISASSTCRCSASATTRRTRPPQDVVDAMKAKPGQVSVGTAGVNSSGHTAIEAFTKALGVTYKHVSYDGGNPAVIATVAGETEITTQLAVEQAQMIRGKRLRPLAVLSDRPLELEGFGTIPPITSSVKGYKPDANYFGIFVPQGRSGARAGDPRHGLEGRDHEVGGAEEICDRRTARIAAPAYGDEALKVAMPAIQSTAWRPARRRQVEGRARHGRHSEALTPRCGRCRHGHELAFRRSHRRPRLDRVRRAVVYGSWTMDRLESLGIPPSTAPGRRAGTARRRHHHLRAHPGRPARGGAGPAFAGRAGVRGRGRAGADEFHWKRARAQRRPVPHLWRRAARQRPALLAADLGFLFLHIVLLDETD